MSDIEQFEAVPNPLIPQPDFKVPADMEAALDELETLMKKPAAAADSTEAKVRSQITNRLVLETLYSGALASLQPQKRSGVVYRSDDSGETWKAMTEYKLSGGSTWPFINGKVL